MDAKGKYGQKVPVGVSAGINITAILTVFRWVIFGFLFFTRGVQNSLNFAFAGTGSTIYYLHSIFVPIFSLLGLIASISPLIGRPMQYYPSCYLDRQQIGCKLVDFINLLKQVWLIQRLSYTPSDALAISLLKNLRDISLQSKSENES